MRNEFNKQLKCVGNTNKLCRWMGKGLLHYPFLYRWKDSERGGGEQARCGTDFILVMHIFFAVVSSTFTTSYRGIMHSEEWHLRMPTSHGGHFLQFVTSKVSKSVSCFSVIVFIYFRKRRQLQTKSSIKISRVFCCFYKHDLNVLKVTTKEKKVQMTEARNQNK